MSFTPVQSLTSTKQSESYLKPMAPLYPLPEKAYLPQLYLSDVSVYVEKKDLVKVEKKKEVEVKVANVMDKYKTK